MESHVPDTIQLWCFDPKEVVYLCPLHLAQCLPEREREREGKKVKSLNFVWLFATLWSVAYQARHLHSWDFPGNSTGVGCHFLLQGIFPTQGLNPGLWHCRQTLYHLSHQGSRDSPMFAESLIKWVWTHKRGVFLCLTFYIWFLAKIGSQDFKSMVRHHLDFCVTFLFYELELGLS